MIGRNTEHTTHKPKENYTMARITSRALFDANTFSFEGATAAAAVPANTVVGTAGGYRYGVNLFDNTMTTNYNAGTSRLLSYENDLVRNASGVVTAGVVDAFLKQNLVGSTWVSSFILSDIGGSAVAFDAAVKSASTVDDRAFIATALASDDLVALSKFNDIFNASTGDDTVRGGYGNDLLHGDAGIDRIDGESGIDSVFGDAGNDEIIGGRGNDFLYGGDDNDIMRGGDGDDFLAGGNGADVFSFRMGDDTDTITTFTQGVDMLKMTGMTTATNWVATQSGANTVIDLMGIHIILQNTLVAQMTNADFIFA
jgi:Ca2+-binding RTX toxin-like protein